MNNKVDLSNIGLFIIVDDDTSSLFLSKIIIEMVFPEMKVDTYTNPQKAVDYFVNDLSEHSGATVLLLDVNMPKLSGWDVLNEIGKLDKKIIDQLGIFIHSSSIDPRDKLQATNHPLVLDYLEKPLTPANLEEIMELMKARIMRL